MGCFRIQPLLDSAHRLSDLHGSRPPAADSSRTLLPSIGTRPFCPKSVIILDHESPVASASVSFSAARPRALQERFFDERRRSGAVPSKVRASASDSSAVIELPLLIVCDCLASQTSRKPHQGARLSFPVIYIWREGLALPAKMENLAARTHQNATTRRDVPIFGDRNTETYLLVS